MQNWDEKTTVVKGYFGEKIVIDYLEKKGFVVYKSITNKAHSFDNLAIKDKKTIIIAEVKTKAKLNKFNATGFNIKHYEEYKYISEKYKIPIFVFFVDEMLGKIYGNWLSVLEKDYVDDLIYPNKKVVKDVILFSINNMLTIDFLSKEQILFLKKYSNRNYNYQETQDL